MRKIPRKSYTRNCIVCRKEFHTPYKTKLICSKECSKKRKRLMTKDRKPKTDFENGEIFVLDPIRWTWHKELRKDGKIIKRKKSL